MQIATGGEGGGVEALEGNHIYMDRTERGACVLFLPAMNLLMWVKYDNGSHNTAG